MFRKTSGAILCPGCGRLTNAEARVCLVCGRKNPGMWGFAGPLRTLFRRRSVTDVITIACVVFYVASLLIDPAAALQTRGGLALFSAFSPSVDALVALGASGAIPWRYGAWWTLLTAIYLHGPLLHILFNVLWIRQLGPAVEEVYGPARLITIFTVSGAAGFALSTAVGMPLTVGASGSIFGLLGAIVAFGQRRGGTYGAMVLREYGTWALILFLFGLLPGTAVDNWAHAGGFVGGLASGFALSTAERRAERGVDHLMAVAALGLTVLCFGLALWSAFVGLSRS